MRAAKNVVCYFLCAAKLNFWDVHGPRLRGCFTGYKTTQTVAEMVFATFHADKSENLKLAVFRVLHSYVTALQVTDRLA